MGRGDISHINLGASIQFIVFKLNQRIISDDCSVYKLCIFPVHYIVEYRASTQSFFFVLIGFHIWFCLETVQVIRLKQRNFHNNWDLNSGRRDQDADAWQHNDHVFESVQFSVNFLLQVACCFNLPLSRMLQWYNRVQVYVLACLWKNLYYSLLFV